jgi:hypothetical protein
MLAQGTIRNNYGKGSEKKTLSLRRVIKVVRREYFRNCYTKYFITVY